MIALLGDRGTYTATDSTAPIVDGWVSPTICVYTDTPAPLKLKAYKIVESWLNGGRGWDCPCPYCRSFMDRFPCDVVEGRRWWRSEGSPSLDRSSLYSSRPLSRWFPLLARSAEPELDREAALTRVHHNHWVLQRLERDARRASADPERLQDWAARTVDAYLESYAVASWKEAVRQAYGIARDASVAMERARPGGGFAESAAALGASGHP